MRPTAPVSMLLNAFDDFLRDKVHAKNILDLVAVPNVKLMFDCHHVGRSEGDVIARLTDLLPYAGHDQFVGVPGRNSPQQSTLNYRRVFSALRTLGWTHPVGAEYRPDGATQDSLDWMPTLRHS